MCADSGWPVIKVATLILINHFSVSISSGCRKLDLLIFCRKSEFTLICARPLSTSLYVAWRAQSIAWLSVAINNLGNKTVTLYTLLKSSHFMRFISSSEKRENSGIIAKWTATLVVTRYCLCTEQTPIVYRSGWKPQETAGNRRRHCRYSQAAAIAKKLVG